MFQFALKTWASVAVVTAAVLGAAAPGFAADKPNLLIMGEDADEDTVPRDSRVFKRVLAALSNQMFDEGFDIFDETAVTLDNFEQGRVRRTDAELIDIARSVRRPPIDVAVIFSIYASAKELPYTTKIRTRIEGRLLNVKTGQRLGNFEVNSLPEWNGPRKCSRECILETVGGYARTLANDLGAVLAEKLGWLLEEPVVADSGGGDGIFNAYALVFDGFTPDEVGEIEEYLVVFSGYKDHRVVETRPTYSEFWYESDIKTTRLNRNMNKMLAYLDLRATVSFSGNTVRVTKITFRGKERNKDDTNW